MSSFTSPTALPHRTSRSHREVLSPSGHCSGIAETLDVPLYSSARNRIVEKIGKIRKGVCQTFLLAERARSECARSTRAIESSTDALPNVLSSSGLRGEEENRATVMLLCSRNARPRKTLVGRAQGEQDRDREGKERATAASCGVVSRPLR